MNCIELTAALRGYTLLLSLEFSVELDTGNCTLIPNLVDGEAQDAKSISAEFSGVSNLQIRDFGGGITQLLLLVVEDIRYRQLDRLNYQIRELERDAMSFMCRTVIIKYLGHRVVTP
jgi:hypothetical protein